MKSEQKQLWDKLIDVWKRDTPACQTYVAEIYTERFPDDFFGWIVLGDALTNISSFERAKIALRTARRLCPDDQKSWLYSKWGNLYREKGNLIQAERWYRKAVSTSESQENLVFLGACLAKQGKYLEARHYHERAAAIDPAKADEAFLNLGLILRAEADFVEALRYFEKAIQIDSEYEEAIAARNDIIELLKIRASLANSRGQRKPREI